MSGSALTIAPQDRLMRALRGIIRQQLARYTHMGTYEYSVSSSDGTTVDMKPTDTTISLPGLQGIPLRLCGMTAKPATGQLVLLSFINGDPTRPAVVNTSPVPTAMAIDATASASFGASSSSVAVGGSGSSVSLAGGTGAASQLAYATAWISLLTAVNTFAGAVSMATSLPQVVAAGLALTNTLGPLATTSYHTTKTTAA